MYTLHPSLPYFSSLSLHPLLLLIYPTLFIISSLFLLPSISHYFPLLPLFLPHFSLSHSSSLFNLFFPYLSTFSFLLLFPDPCYTYSLFAPSYFLSFPDPTPTPKRYTYIDLPLGRRTWIGLGQTCGMLGSVSDSAFCPHLRWTSSWRPSRCRRARTRPFSSPRCLWLYPFLSEKWWRLSRRGLIRSWSFKVRRGTWLATKQECSWFVD